ncbi:hypothetical protein PAXRUDRAFT_15527 [Paxillus rubicundulus Ve08.2h10]|uniref:Uncharacterized protein n=1 Tax=Paxillus rubicundulus Ve08.2h10 TaxID=930991 RepID=A0A0D0DAH2_9AGAM|nr:hypothetical protein PAXRUDRAFT_15527 [Paxillus rubicundulus Ve08.2h10]
MSDPLIDRSTSNPTVTDPLTTNTSSTSHKAVDIEFFFQKEKENTICKPCKSIAAELADKGESYNVVYHFSPKMSNTSLHYHMEGRHTLLYLDQAKKHGWAIQSKLVKAVFMSGYTFKSLKHVLTQPGVKLDDLPPPPPPPPPDPSDRLPMGIIPSRKQGLVTSLQMTWFIPPFILGFAHLTHNG